MNPAANKVALRRKIIGVKESGATTVIIVPELGVTYKMV